MTSEEYKGLLAEWRKSDSIKRRNEIADMIYGMASKLLVRLNRLYDKYGKCYVTDDDYIEDRGSLKLDMDYAYDDRVVLEYSDSWAYGGSCDILIRVPVKYLDEDEWNNLESRLKGERIDFLSKKIEESHASIEAAKKFIEKSEKEIGRLKSAQ